MGKFKPEEHFRNLKGQQYLEVKWRVIWFREEHPDGCIRAELIEHDADEGRAVFKARVGWRTAEGQDVFAEAYGSETRKDFADYLEKGDTKAVGRALALLGYGTAQATELDEGATAVVDSPVDKPVRGKAAPSTSEGTPTTGQPSGTETLRADVQQRLEADPDAVSKLPKPVAEMNADELAKSLSWLARRARTLSS